MLIRGSLLVAALTAALVVHGSSSVQISADSERAAPDRKPVDAGDSKHRYLGPATCASMNCHNGPGVGGGGAYGTWVAHDKHAHAYQILLDVKSRRILHNLRGPRSSEAGEMRPEREGLCLRCHVLPDAERVAVRNAGFINEGVSCEACHGPAEHWLSRHHRGDWRGLSAAAKQTLGMSDTRSLPGRIETCMPCHVGAPGMEVNHDLIAAGHPKLKFEFAAYHALMPHHWSDRRDKDPARGGRSDFEARAWVLGQVACARASLQLLAARAGNEAAPWPEFAEYDCLACHQALRPSVRAISGLPSGGEGKRLRRPGGLQWSQWPYAQLHLLDDLAERRQDRKVANMFAELEKEMAKPLPDRKQTAALAEMAVTQCAEIEDKLAERDYHRAWDAHDLFLRLAATPLADNWEAAGQHYLGLAALHNAWKDSSPRTVPAALVKQLRQLKAPLVGQEEFAPDLFRERLRSIQILAR